MFAMSAEILEALGETVQTTWILITHKVSGSGIQIDAHFVKYQ
jgi:hypothetical protein